MAQLNKFAHEAMSTTFEVILATRASSDTAAKFAGQAAQAIFSEVDRIEGIFSHFMESSDVSRINALAAAEPVRVTIETFECLRLAQKIHAETDGAFDIGYKGDIGADALVFDDSQITVTANAAAGKKLILDLGGIGKGFALDAVTEILEDWSEGDSEIEAALLKGSESTILAIGTQPDKKGWHIRLDIDSEQSNSSMSAFLRDAALSSSGTRVQGEHIIDPDTDKPAAGALQTWALVDNKNPWAAARADALSTAFMVLGPEKATEYCREHEDVSALVLIDKPEGARQLLRIGKAWDDVLSKG